MKLIDKVAVTALLLIFYLILGDGGLLNGWVKNFKQEPPKETFQAKNFESSFAKELPEEYYPKHPENFPNEEKLGADLEFRRKKLEYSFTEEKEEIESLNGTEAEKATALRALKAKHQEAMQNLNQRHTTIMNEFREKRAHHESLNQGLR